MGTATVENNTALAVTKVAEILAPTGSFEIKRNKLVSEARQAVVKAQEITAVTNDEEEQQATDAGRVLMVSKKELETIYTEAKRIVDAVKKPLLEREKQDIGPVTAEKNRLGVEMTKYAGEKRRRREADRLVKAGDEAARGTVHDDDGHVAAARCSGGSGLSPGPHERTAAQRGCRDDIRSAGEPPARRRRKAVAPDRGSG